MICPYIRTGRMVRNGAVVAWWCVMPDGCTVLRWTGATTHGENGGHPSTALYDSLEDCLAIHEHLGTTFEEGDHA